MDTTVLVLIIVAVVLVAAVVALGVMLLRRKQSERLQEQFGPEYERRVVETGDRREAESDLRARQERRNELEIRDLRPEERRQFQQTWKSVQRDFVDDPTRALDDADRLVAEVMQTRGYPVEDFDRRAEDISVDHADVVRHYRDAHAVREESAGRQTDTERQRHALTSYRTLVESLIGPSTTGGPDERATADRSTNGRHGQRDNNQHTDTVRPTEERTR